MKTHVAFRQNRVFNRARHLALSSIVNMGRQTITGLITSSGRQFHDWSADYRLFSQKRFDLDQFFKVVQNELIDDIPKDTPVVAAMDDTLLKKTGTKIPGVSYRRDPMGPPFHTNFIRAQRFIQVSIALPDGGTPCGARMVPVDFRHAPTPKKPKKNAPEHEWTAYKKLCNEINLNITGGQRIRALRKSINEMKGGTDRHLIVTVDGSYTNKTIFRGLANNTTLIGRIRKDAKLYFLPENSELESRGRKRVYGRKAPTPEELRISEDYDWETADVFAVGKIHKFQYKTIAPLRSRIAGGDKLLRLIVIRPLAYRLTKNSRTLYRKPAYIVCTDSNLPIRKVLQYYVWRWEVEVNIRDEKQIMGTGQAQVRNESACSLVPGFQVACYALLLLAGAKTFGVDGRHFKFPLPKWRKHSPCRKASTGDLVTQMKADVWSDYLGVNNFSSFIDNSTSATKLEKSLPHLSSCILFAVA